MRNVLLSALVFFGLSLVGCAGTRVVMDIVPAENKLTETVVHEDKSTGWGADKVAIIDVSGMIIDARMPGLITDRENPVARFLESLRKAEDDRAVKAVIVRINSPGGTVTASDVMYRELQDFKERTSKPVVVLMGAVAASGGYYLACAADEVIAHPTTITGSIGVIMQTFNFSEGMNRIGIRADAITSGPNKSMGSPFAPMPAEHRELLQGIVDEFYADFVAVVKSNRATLSDSQIGWITDGRVVTGKKAAEVGLIDSIGDLHDAFDAAKVRANIQHAKLVKYHRPIEYVGSAHANAPIGSMQINLMQLNMNLQPLGQPGFYYLWRP